MGVSFPGSSSQKVLILMIRNAYLQERLVEIPIRYGPLSSSIKSRVILFVFVCVALSFICLVLQGS